LDREFGGFATRVLGVDENMVRLVGSKSILIEGDVVYMIER
jgi:hypothetical protein